MSDSEESEEKLDREMFEERLIEELVYTILKRVSNGETEWQSEVWNLWVCESSGGVLNAHVMYHCTSFWVRFKDKLLKEQQLKGVIIKDVRYCVSDGSVKVILNK